LAYACAVQVGLGERLCDGAQISSVCDPVLVNHSKIITPTINVSINSNDNPFERTRRQEQVRQQAERIVIVAPDFY
jgi:hypothetical protein